MDYSIVICTYNRPEMCRQSILWLYEVMPAHGELLVVDQSAEGQRLNLVDLPAKNTLPLRIFQLAAPSLTKARNVGLREAKGKVVIYLDDDIKPLPHLILGHLASYTDASIGGVAGQVLEEKEQPGAHPNSGATPPDLGSPNAWKHTNLKSSRPQEVQTSRGCNMSFLRSVLQQVNGFDHLFFPPLVFRDDTDACLSVRAAGYRIWYQPDAALYHLDFPTGGTRNLAPRTHPVAAEIRMYRRLFQHYRCNLYFHCKHFTGRVFWLNLLESHQLFVGTSRYPWRMLAKNLLFITALLRALQLRYLCRSRGLNDLKSDEYSEILHPQSG